MNDYTSNCYSWVATVGDGFGMFGSEGFAMRNGCWVFGAGFQGCCFQIEFVLSAENFLSLRR